MLLALLVGPILVLLIQLSLRRGTVAAFAAALGIWTSDISFVLVTHFGIGKVDSLLAHTYFSEIVGSIGGVLLLVIAAVTWFSDPPDLDKERASVNRRGLFSAYLQGFVINTFNPFTIFFWSAFTITQVHDRELADPAAWAVYGGVIGTIIVTDIVKVLAARKLRELLTPRVILRVQRLGALALGLFGLVLAVRVWL